MKRIVILVFITIFLYFLLVYLLNNLQVFNEDMIEFYREENQLLTVEEFEQFFGEIKNAGLVLQILNLKNFIAISIVVFLFSMSAFTSIHMFIDKMFFKKFYQQPNTLLALRRGIFFSLIVSILGFFRIFGLWDMLIVFSTVLLIILLEVIITIYVSPGHRNNIEHET